MPIGAIIQARWNSRRFPGKLLQDLEPGKPVLQYTLESVQQCHAVEEIVVATTTHSSDDAIAAFCRQHSIPCHRGDEGDVTRRLCDVVRESHWHACVRVSGDSPLLDHRLINRALDIAARSGADVVTNVFPRTFPVGQSVELLRAGTLLSSYERMTSDFDREQVTTYFYRHAREYTIRNFTASGVQRGDLHLAVDSPDDLDRVAELLRRLDRPHWDYSLAELIELWPDDVAARRCVA